MGRNRRAPGGALGAVLVGIIGGLIGGWVMSLFAGRGPVTFLGSLIVAILGAVAILYGLRAAQGRTSV